MVDSRTILQLVEFTLCTLYDGVALIVIPDCIEAIAFYAKIVAAVHVDVREQIQSLKLVIAHILLVLVVVNITLTLPSLFTYIYVTFTFPMEGQFKVYLQFVHSSVLRVYIYV